ncbi:sterol desaturase/sphingolipid hydroxylase (fatty acid hydroxylase superfamily) [Humitalea rosea]|uniref:Sterol desaturase/sphingolipid hydroxylase (Fatty acid hydroxylase superfamily) n=1 Tax=Humitalea rosea TaxID=990373 RepID=A0A2W7K6I0_9PROT|nr:sterol desaturase family protein [Humitalea rosea]PZW43120.1 sterol desaturase/sphingolipid hydroxylase (fatty acid hydroxylase superfamily) [Humitalea rosea]
MTAAEPYIRLGAFLGVLALVALAELLAPWRRPQARGRRWLANLGVLALDGLAVRLAFPAAAIGAAFWAEAEGIGLLRGLPGWAAIPLAVLALDLAIYLQHRVFHAVPWLWRLHRMHHADTEIDATTGLRFHPGEILLSMAIKIAVVVALGAAPVAVLVFEVLLNATAMFSHGNLALPPALDRRLRRLLVTPAMHRVHHSVLRAETDSNFGFCLPWWDRLLGTYRAAPAAGPDGVTIGLPVFRGAEEQRLDRLLTQPFRAETP